MSDSNRLGMGYVKESTFGTTPASPALSTVRLTGESLGQDPTYSQSAEIVATRDVANIIRTDLSASGDVNFELMAGLGVDGGVGPPYGFPDDWMLALLQGSDWTERVSVSPSCTIESITTSSTTYPKIVRTTGSFATDGFIAGEWLYIASAGTAANAGVYCKIHSVAALEMEVIPANASNDLTTDATPAATGLVQGSSAANGTTFDTYSIEKRYGDLAATHYEKLVGMGVTRMTMNVASGALLTGVFGFMGKNASSGEIPSSTDTAASTAAPMNAIDHVQAFLEGASLPGTATTGVTAITFDAANALRARGQVSELGAISIGVGTFSCQGTLQAYYTDYAIVDKLLNATQTAVAYVVDSGGSTPSGVGYVFEWPAVRFTRGRRVAGGRDQDVLADMAWEAFKHPTELIMMRISRFF